MRYMIKIMMNSMENDQGLKHIKNQKHYDKFDIIHILLFTKYGKDLGSFDVLMSFTEKCRQNRICLDIFCFYYQNSFVTSCRAISFAARIVYLKKLINYDFARKPVDVNKKGGVFFNN